MRMYRTVVLHRQKINKAQEHLPNNRRSGVLWLDAVIRDAACSGAVNWPFLR
jgi:hypothetical protein